MPRLTLEEKEKKLLQKLHEVKIANAKLRKEETEKMHQRIYELHLKDFWDYGFYCISGPNWQWITNYELEANAYNVI